MKQQSKLIRIPLILHDQLKQVLQNIEIDTGLKITISSYASLAIREKMEKSVYTEECSE